jgi:hypothetical protein
MLFEDIMLLILLGSGVFLVGIPFYKLVRTVVPRKKNPLADAKERLEQARLEVEAARLDKERERLYNKMYDEALQEQDETETKQQEKK